VESDCQDSLVREWFLPKGIKSRRIRLKPSINSVKSKCQLALWNWVLMRSHPKHFMILWVPATFMTLMNSLFHQYLDKFVLVFTDDILIFSKTVEEHKDHFRKVFAILRANKLFAKMSKCEFFQIPDWLSWSSSFWRWNFSDPNKVKVIKDWMIPKDKIEVRSFLGLASYYRRFVRGFSKIATPMTNLLKGKFDLIVWNLKCDLNFFWIWSFWNVKMWCDVI